MSSDRARETYDDTRQYRRVVQQQGRVVLESDTNESRQIATEAMRRQVFDVIGTHGVPTDPVSGAKGAGYQIDKPDHATRDFAIGAGAIYAGGWCVRQDDATLSWQGQSRGDWLDLPTGPAAHGSAPEIVYLRLREQEIGATEDPTLIEPALGGPDTAQRVRLIRHVGRAPLAQGRVPLRDLDWGGPGIVLGADQTSLIRTARLTVGFAAAAAAYQGPENQMIRVQGSAPGGATAASELLWAYDNGSALFQATLPDPKDHSTVALTPAPADFAHQPKSGQYAELLLPCADLGPGGFAAAPTGTVLRVVRPYNPGAGTIGLESAVPPPYATASPLFVRLWENSLSIAAFTGAAAPLVDASGKDTGLTVTVSAANQAPAVVPGDYWSFALRPATPDTVYPARYLTPQPPDGPREWVCPLAEIHWDPIRVIDLRGSFGPLTAVSACREACVLTLGPEDLKSRTLEAWIETMPPPRNHLTIALEPGRYELERPINLRHRHTNLTIEARCGPAEFIAAPHALEHFNLGLFRLQEVNGVTLRGLRFTLPETLFGEFVREELVRGAERHRTSDHHVFRLLDTIRHTMGVHINGCANVTVEDCAFHLPRHREHEGDGFVFGGCIAGAGDVSGLTVSNSRFSADTVAGRTEPHLLFGYLQAQPASDERALLADAMIDHRDRLLEQPVREGLSGSLSEAEFRGNTFDRLTAATLIACDTGHIRHQDNRVRESFGGFWTFSTNGGSGTAHSPRLNFALDKFGGDPLIYVSLALARSVDYPAAAAKQNAPSLVSVLQCLGNAVDSFWTAFIAWHAGADEGGSAVLSGNHMTSLLERWPTVGLMGLNFVSVAGNVLLNRATDGIALSHSGIEGAGHYATAGNAYQGTMS